MKKMSGCKYLTSSDLTVEQIKITTKSYDKNAYKYAEEWEWSSKAQLRTKNDYLIPFIKKLNPKDTVLIVGCGTGRDLLVLQDKDYHCLGVDSSKGMLGEAVRRGIISPLIHSDILKLPLIDSSFDGILCDSALQHIAKKNILELKEKFLNALKIGGILLLRLRLGSGKTFVTHDDIGNRYYTSYQMQEFEDLFNNHGFAKIEEKEVKHLDNMRPPFYSLFLRKVK